MVTSVLFSFLFPTTKSRVGSIFFAQNHEDNRLNQMMHHQLIGDFSTTISLQRGSSSSPASW